MSFWHSPKEERITDAEHERRYQLLLAANRAIDHCLMEIDKLKSDLQTTKDKLAKVNMKSALVL